MISDFSFEGFQITQGRSAKIIFAGPRYVDTKQTINHGFMSEPSPLLTRSSQAYCGHWGMSSQSDGDKTCLLLNQWLMV